MGVFLWARYPCRLRVVKEEEKKKKVEGAGSHRGWLALVVQIHGQLEAFWHRALPAETPVQGLLKMKDTHRP